MRARRSGPPPLWPRFSEAVRGEALTAHVGRILGIGFALCFLTGLYSHYQYGPDTWAPVPAKFEAGTPPIIESVGLRAAIDYVSAVGMPAVEAHERRLVEHAARRLSDVEGLTVLGRAQDRGGVFSFALDNAHPHDLSTLLDRAGIAVRAGRHCAEPLHARFGQEGGTCRASFGLYTTVEGVDTLAQALVKAREFFA